MKLIQRARYRRFCLLESEAYNGLIYTWEIIISNSVYTGLTEVHPRPASTSDCRGCFDGSQWNLGLHCSLCANPYFLPRLLTSFTDRGTTFAGTVNAAARACAVYVLLLIHRKRKSDSLFLYPIVFSFFVLFPFVFVSMS